MESSQVTFPRSPCHNCHCSQVIQSLHEEEANSFTNTRTAECKFTELGFEHGIAKVPTLSCWYWNCDVADKKIPSRKEGGESEEKLGSPGDKELSGQMGGTGPETAKKRGIPRYSSFPFYSRVPLSTNKCLLLYKSIGHR